MKKVLFTILTIVFITSFSLANAQVPSSIDGVDISVSPDNPSPNSTVEVKIVSYITDLNAASMLWVVDGKMFSKGMGIKSIKILAPNLGKTKLVDVIIQTPEGREVRKSVTIKVADLDLIWESHAHTAPMFKGKAGFAYQNIIRVIAVPHIYSNQTSEINPQNLVYKWKVGEKVFLEQSGYGKQYIDINAGDIPKTLDIVVTVTTRDGLQQGESFLTLKPDLPSVNFYEVDPLYGILFNSEIGGRISMKNTETTIYAVPFNFNTDDKLNYVWSVNNIEQPDLSKKQSITLRTKGDANGSSNIKVDITNSDNILQAAQSSFTTVFRKKLVEETNTAF